MISEEYPDVLHCLAVWREARNQTQDARRGVWWVILNRTNHKQFGTGIVGVILKPWQFSSFNANDPNAVKFPNPANVLDWQAWQEICSIGDDPGTDDPTGGAVYYETFDPAELDAIREKQPWFAADKLTCQIGAVRFYKL